MFVSYRDAGWHQRIVGADGVSEQPQVPALEGWLRVGLLGT